VEALERKGEDIHPTGKMQIAHERPEIIKKNLATHSRKVQVVILNVEPCLVGSGGPTGKRRGNLWVLTSHPSGEISDDIRGTQIHAQSVPVDHV
jgi:hypothetical protein